MAKKPAKKVEDAPMLLGGDDAAPAKPVKPASTKSVMGSSKVAADDSDVREGAAPEPAPAKRASGRSASRGGGSTKETTVALAKPVGPAVPAPVSLDSILGQPRALAVMRSAFASGRIHHAWVFHGPMGVGKFTAALAFAAILLDPSAHAARHGDIDLDSDSPVQHLLRAGSHPDLRIITKELAAVSRDAAVRTAKQRNIPKAVLEEFLIEPSTRSATMGGLTGEGSGGLARARSVFIVDEADLIDVAGQNTLLKTLEEPAAGRVIMLITSAPEQLLPTVLSRCQRVGFAGLSSVEMDRWLVEAGKRDADLPASLAPAQREWLLQFADGSPGVATTALKTGLLEWHATLAPMLDRAVAGKPPIELGETIAKLVDQWAEAQIEGRPTASKEAAKAAGLDHMLRLIASHWRHALRHEAASGRSRDDAGVLRAIDLLRDAERQLAANVQPGFVFENLSAAMIA